MHLGQPGFTHSACRLLTKNKERIKKIKLLDKACFQHDMAYGDFKDLNRKHLLIMCYMITLLILLKIENMIIINMELVQWFTNF